MTLIKERKREKKKHEIITNHSSVERRDRLLGTRRHLDFGLFGVDIVRHNGGIVARSARQFTAISSVLLELAHNGTLRHLTDWQDVSNSNSG